jgi:hypothetical protein
MLWSSKSPEWAPLSPQWEQKVGSDEEYMNGSINHTTSWLLQNKTNVELYLTVESYEIRKQMRHK